MHHGNLKNEETVTHKLYAILSAPNRIGKWFSPLTILLILQSRYGITVTAISTYLSSIRLQLRDDYPEWGQRLQGPRDEQPTNMGPGNFYRIIGVPMAEEKGQFKLC